MRDIIVCSFHTDDDYYRRHGKELGENLSALGVPHVIEEIVKEEGQDWADLCRKKVPFLQRVCEENPTSKVFWIDVDCRLLSLPDFVADSTADITGFQRGFGSPLSIGYHRRGRFWEPCFWGVSPTPEGRRMIADAAELEARSELKATDDFFFEEGWRANAAELTFQVIPSTCVVGKGGPLAEREAFFAFGSSGNVDEFKGKVVQHQSSTSAGGRRLPGRRTVVKAGKRVLATLPPKARRRVMGFADRSGVTAALIPGSQSPGGVTQASLPTAKVRKGLVNQILRAGIDGNAEQLGSLIDQVSGHGLVTRDEQSTIDAALAFNSYSSRQSDEPPVSLLWWVRPFPGNYGDWLSPLVVSRYTDRPISFLSPTAPALTTGRHLVAVGSVGRFIRANSVVVGTGVASDEFDLHPSATYLSLRGPLTAQHLKACGGPDVESFGDPAVILSRLLPIDRSSTNGRTAFVRHFKHRNLPISLPEGYDELPVLMSHPDRIREFVETLGRYDRVVTSAMHVMITCHSYGIPCALVVFEGYGDAVPGNGMKYTDYALGAGVDPVAPNAVPLDLRTFDLEPLVSEQRVSEDKKDEVEEALRRAVAAVVGH